MCELPRGSATGVGTDAGIVDRRSALPLDYMHTPDGEQRNTVDQRLGTDQKAEQCQRRVEDVEQSEQPEDCGDGSAEQ